MGQDCSLRSQVSHEEEQFLSKRMSNHCEWQRGRGGISGPRALGHDSVRFWVQSSISGLPRTQTVNRCWAWSIWGTNSSMSFLNITPAVGWSLYPPHLLGTWQSHKHWLVSLVCYWVRSIQPLPPSPWTRSILASSSLGSRVQPSLAQRICKSMLIGSCDRTPG